VCLVLLLAGELNTYQQVGIELVRIEQEGIMSRKAKMIATLVTALVMAAFVVLPPVNGQMKDPNDRGRKLYVQYCASCHGVDAKGSGPVAAALKTAPTDLTTIAKRHDGKFNVVHVKLNISGENDVTAHGTKDMPVWGAYFRSQRGQSVSTLNVYALAKYLEDIQVK
jgi:mono/diheme cytochrome c family protein